jgi:Flp pilus assembly protein TadG
MNGMDVSFGVILARFQDALEATFADVETGGAAVMIAVIVLLLLVLAFGAEVGGPANMRTVGPVRSISRPA